MVSVHIRLADCTFSCSCRATTVSPISCLHTDFDREGETLSGGHPTHPRGEGSGRAHSLAYLLAYYLLIYVLAYYLLACLLTCLFTCYILTYLVRETFTNTNTVRCRQRYCYEHEHGRCVTWTGKRTQTSTQIRHDMDTDTDVDRHEHGHALPVRKRLWTLSETIANMYTVLDMYHHGWRTRKMETDGDMNTMQHTVTESDMDIVKHSNEQRLRPTSTWKRHRRETRTLSNTDMVCVRCKRTRTQHRRGCRHCPTQTTKLTTILLWNTNITTRDRDYYCVSRTQMYYLLTYMLTYLLIYLLTTYLLACLLTYLHACLLTHLLTYLLITYKISYLLAHLLITYLHTTYLLCLLIHTLTYLLTFLFAYYLLTYLITYYLLARLLPYLLIYLVANTIWRGTRTQTLSKMGMDMQTMQAEYGHEHNSPSTRMQTQSDTDKEVDNHTVMKH